MSDCTLTGLTGGNYCQAGNPMGVATGIYFAKSTQKFAAADFLLKTKFTRTKTTLYFLYFAFSPYL